MKTPSSLDPERTVITTGNLLPGYEFVSVIGKGGFGRVLQARQLKLDRVVALKVIQLDKDANPGLAARFEQEAVTLGRFHHPNIVQVYDYGYHDGRLFIAMELLEGEDLGQRLKQAGRLDERFAWALARQTASALAHAAALGVVHRDVKPPNLFLSPAPTGIGLPRDIPLVKVTDFGLALTKWAVDASEGRLTAPGTVLGTPVYMAPEQYRVAAGLDHRVDIYGLGATVYHALAGHPPFDGATIWHIMAKKLEHAPRGWPDVSRESVELLQAMMAPDPQDRIGTYEELIDRIERLPALHEPSFLASGSNSGAASRHPATRTRPTRSRWMYAAAAAGMLALIGMGVGVRLGRWTTPPSAGVDQAPATRYVSNGDQEALITSESLSGWRPPSAGGAWKIETDDEGAVVLSGTGFTRRLFTPSENYRLTIGLDVYTAAAAEVHFAIPAKSPDAGRRFVLRVSKSEGAIFGTREGDKGMFHPLGKPIAFPSPDWFEGRRPYLEVRLQRAGGEWAVWFNGVEAGRATDDGPPKGAEVRIYAHGGNGGYARIDSAILEKLTKMNE